MFPLFRLLLLTLLAGCCCRLPNHRVISQERPLSEEVNQAYSTGLFADSCWPEDKWWKVFHDPDLEQLIETAFYYNPDMEIAASKIRKVQSQVRLAESTLWPIINGFAEIIPQEYTRTGQFPPNTLLPLPFNFAQTDLSINLNWDLDIWSKNRNRLRSERDLFFAEVWNRSTTKLLLGIAVAESYFKLKVALQVEAVAKAIAENRQQKEALVKLRVQNKLANQLAFLAIQQETFNRVAAYEDAKKARELHEHALYTLVATGEPLPCISPDFSLDLFPFPLPSCLALDTLSRRPDIQAELWAIRSTEHLFKVARAGYYPDINISALLGLSTIFPTELFFSQSSTYSVGPALHLPIFRAGEIEANIDEAAENYRMAIEQYNALVLHAIQEVKDAFTSVERYNNEWIASTARSQSAHEAVDLMRLRLQKLSSGLDFLDQEQIEQLARIDQIVISANLVISLLELVKAVGG